MPRYMLEVIVVVLLGLWLLGAFITPVGSNLIHLLLVVAVLVAVTRLLRGRPMMY